ncbi:unnamed protein product [Dovyalis caffra]|uniref:Uncharacterized protein n=1 Tax=Dovyalis caffra TaxID=77055 RepID=A0AAV1S4H7_9ROSI|nr:unnamed protein product [Dovyalis caffra]
MTKGGQDRWFNISIKKLLGKNHIQSWEVVSSGLKEWIFQQLKDKRSRYSYRMCSHDPSMNDLHEILSKRGDQVIGGERCLENFGWSVNCSDFNESLLMWHIATDICYHDEVRKKDGIGKERYKQNCNDVSKFSTEVETLISGAEWESFRFKFKTQVSDVSVLYGGSMLAQPLQRLETKDSWENKQCSFHPQ